MSDDDWKNVDVVPNKPWHNAWFWVLAMIVAVFAAGAWCFLDIPGFVTGETDIFGEYRFRQEQQEEREAMTPIARVHAELFPQWLIAEANGWDNAAERYGTLYEAVADPELKAVLDEMSGAIASGLILAPPRPAPMDMGMGDADAGEVVPEEEIEPELNPLHVELLRRWNARLEQLKEPYYITGSIWVTGNGPAFICEFYRRLEDPVVTVAGRKIPTVILQRIDQTNVVESYLGVARRGDVAVVVTDRILELATDRVWLLLNPETRPDDALTAAYADAIRAEAKAGLGQETFDVLQQSAVERKRLLDTVAGVLERAECGSTMRFGTIAWDGFNPATLDRLDAYAERDRIMPCPAMKFGEVDVLRDASEELQSDETKAALQKLVAWLTRMIALHEARHVADELEYDRLQDPKTCPGCPDWIRRHARAELSAYVASFAWSANPATAMYQACKAASGPHARAMHVINEELGRTCADAPPPDLAEQAKALQKKLFGVAPAMSLPADFPAELTIHRFR